MLAREETWIRVRQGPVLPHIRVPDNEWFTRALLYWDEIGTIVPYGPPDEVREILGEHTLGLMDAGLVGQGVVGDGVPRFDEAFIELVEADPAIPMSSAAGSRRKTFQLHITKPGYELTAYLESRGLLTRTDSSWLEVEERTADLLMTYLACTLGASEYVQMTPITDRAESLAVLSGSSPASHAPGTEVSTLEMTVLEVSSRLRPVERRPTSLPRSRTSTVRCCVDSGEISRRSRWT